MQLFAIAFDPTGTWTGRVEDAVLTARAHVPQLGSGDVQTLVSLEGRLSLSAAAPARHVAGRRRYLHVQGTEAALFDGLPVSRTGAIAGHDAGELLTRWTAAPEDLAGAFAAARVNLVSEVVDVLTGPLGLCQVFLRQDERRWVLSNSVDAVEAVAGVDGLDELGAATMLGLGWAAGGRTLSRGVRALSGGAVHRLSDQGHDVEELLAPHLTVPGRLRAERPRAGDVAATLRTAVGQTGAVTAAVRCGLTAGKDSRAVLALGLAAQLGLSLYTVGADEDADVAIARQIAAAIGAPHEVWHPPVPPSGDDWLAATTAFTSQTSGLANLASIADWVDNQREAGPLGVKLWGVAGEIGRGAIGRGTALAAGAPWAVPARVARRVLHAKISESVELLAPAAVEATRAYLDRFAADRLAEGWRPPEVLEAYYAYERIPNWAAPGVRRAAATSDVFSPFATPDFIRLAFAAPSTERYAELPHQQLIAASAPELLELPLEHPWRRHHPRAAPLMIAAQSLRPRGGAAASGVAVAGRRYQQYGHAWLEHGIATARELVAAHRDADLWSLADRREVQRLLEASPDDRRPHLDVLCRVVTALVATEHRSLVAA